VSPAQQWAAPASANPGCLRRQLGHAHVGGARRARGGASGGRGGDVHPAPVALSLCTGSAPPTHSVALVPHTLYWSWSQVPRTELGSGLRANPNAEGWGSSGSMSCRSSSPGLAQSCPGVSPPSPGRDLRWGDPKACPASSAVPQLSLAKGSTQRPCQPDFHPPRGHSF
jgi:hypothetical protein